MLEACTAQAPPSRRFAFHSEDMAFQRFGHRCCWRNISLKEHIHSSNTDYFKWFEAEPEKQAMIKFIEKNIIHRFGLLESITTDQALAFIEVRVQQFASDLQFKLLRSSSHIMLKQLVTAKLPT